MATYVACEDYPAYPSKLKMLASAFTTAMGGKPVVLTSSAVNEPHNFSMARIAQIAVSEDVVDPVRAQWRLMAKLPDGQSYWVAYQRYSYDEVINVLKDREVLAARQSGLSGSDTEILTALKDSKQPSGSVLKFLNS